MVISLYPLPFFVWVRIAVKGCRRNLAQGAGSAKTATASTLPVSSPGGSYWKLSQGAIFTYINALLIDKDLCECWNILINFSYALLFVSFIRRPLHFPPFILFLFLFFNINNNSSYSVYCIPSISISSNSLRFLQKVFYEEAYISIARMIPGTFQLYPSWECM